MVARLDLKGHSKGAGSRDWMRGWAWRGLSRGFILYTLNLRRLSRALGSWRKPQLGSARDSGLLIR